jgi:hypothetical protein
MPQVKYIANGVKTDSIVGIGFRWEPGQVRNVTAEVAQRLTAFSDTWETVPDSQETGLNGFQVLDNKSKLHGANLSEEIGLTTEAKTMEEPLPVIDFHGMSKDALIEYASTKYNEKLDKRQSAETLRHKVIALFGQHELDAG